MHKLCRGSFAYLQRCSVHNKNGKENGNYYNRLGLYRNNGKENGNYYNGLYDSFLKLGDPNVDPNIL